MAEETFTLEDINELGDLLDQAIDRHDGYDMLGADGYMTAMAMLPEMPPAREWIAHIVNTEGSDESATGDLQKDKRMRELLLKRIKYIKSRIANSQLIDPIIAVSDENDPSDPDGYESLGVFCFGLVDGISHIYSSMKKPDDSIVLYMTDLSRYIPDELLPEEIVKAKNTLSQVCPVEDKDLEIAILDMASVVAETALVIGGYPLPEDLLEEE